MASKLINIRWIRTGLSIKKETISSMASKQVNIRWIRTGSKKMAGEGEIKPLLSNDTTVTYQSV